MLPMHSRIERIVCTAPNRFSFLVMVDASDIPIASCAIAPHFCYHTTCGGPKVP